jgi:hypothetical protein
MKLVCLALVTWLSIPLVAQGAEVYSGLLKAQPRDQQGVHEFQIRIEFDVKDDKLSGKLFNVNARKCKGPVPITGMIAGDAVAFRSSPDKPTECGLINFQGMRDGDAFVGKVPWHGGQVDLVLKRQP